MNDNEKTLTLRTWSAPELLRLNQAEGTDKHILLTEGVSGSGPTACGGSDFGSGGPGVCGPS